MNGYQRRGYVAADQRQACRQGGQEEARTCSRPEASIKTPHIHVCGRLLVISKDATMPIAIALVA
jgi:hypothetical protein